MNRLMVRVDRAGAGQQVSRWKKRMDPSSRQGEPPGDPYVEQRIVLQGRSHGDQDEARGAQGRCGSVTCRRSPLCVGREQPSRPISSSPTRVAQDAAVPRSQPTRNGRPAASETTKTCRIADQSTWRRVCQPSTPPIVAAAARPSTNDIGATLGPVAMSQGASGTKAPAANVTSEESAEAHGEPSSAGFTPSTARE